MADFGGPKDFKAGDDASGFTAADYRYLADGVKALVEPAVVPPLELTNGAVHVAYEPGFWAKLSGPISGPTYSDLPYSFKEQYRTTGDVWSDRVRVGTKNAYEVNHLANLDGKMAWLHPSAPGEYAFQWIGAGASGMMTLCCDMTTCTGGTPPNSTFVCKDDTGAVVTPSSTTATGACFGLPNGHTYVICATVPSGWVSAGCSVSINPRGGVMNFFTKQAPNVIGLTSSSETCNGGAYRSDTLTWSATCPFSVKPNGQDIAGYYGGSIFTINWVENLGTYSPCGPFADGSTVYDGINGATFYNFIPSSAPGASDYRLFTIPTNGTQPGLYGGQGVAYNPCLFPYTETAIENCYGLVGGTTGSDGFFMQGGCCESSGSNANYIISHCWTNPGSCLDCGIPGVVTGLAPGAFSLVWNILS